MVGKNELQLDKEVEQGIEEENVDENDQEEVDDDDDDEVDDVDDDDDGIEVALARCIENADRIGLRRSTRTSTYRDANLAALLQEQILDEHCLM